MAQSEIIMTIETECTPYAAAFHPEDNFCFVYSTAAGVIVFRQLVPPEERSESEVSSGDFDIDNRFKPRAVTVFKIDLDAIVYEIRWTEKFLILNTRNEVLVTQVVQETNLKQDDENKDDQSDQTKESDFYTTKITGLNILQKIKVSQLPPPPHITEEEPKQNKKGKQVIPQKKVEKVPTQNVSRGQIQTIFYDEKSQRLFLGHDEGWVSVLSIKNDNWKLENTLVDAADYISGFVADRDSLFVSSGDGTLYKYDFKTLKRQDIACTEDYDLTCLSLASQIILVGTLRKHLNIYKYTDICIPSKVMKVPAQAEFLLELKSGLCLMGLRNGDVHVLLTDPLQNIGVITNIGQMPVSVAAVSSDESLGIFGGTNSRLQIIDMAWTCGDPQEVKNDILSQLGLKQNDENQEEQQQNKIVLNTSYKRSKQLYDANGEELEEKEEGDEEEVNDLSEEAEEGNESIDSSDLFEEVSEPDDKYQKKNSTYGQDGKLAVKKAFFQGL